MTVYLSYSANITPDTQQYKTKIYLLYQTDPLWRALENFLVLQFQLIPDCPRRCTAHPYNSLQLILLPALYLILLWSINEATYSCVFLPSSKPPGQQRDGINNSEYATMKSKATALTYHLWCSTGPAMQLVSAQSWKPLWFEQSQKNLKNLKINCPKKKIPLSVLIFIVMTITNWKTYIKPQMEAHLLWELTRVCHRLLPYWHVWLWSSDSNFSSGGLDIASVAQYADRQTPNFVLFALLPDWFHVMKSYFKFLSQFQTSDPVRDTYIFPIRRGDPTY